MTPNGATIDGYHTKNDFGLIPKNKLLFNPPPPKFVIEENEGASGERDYTESLTGWVAYGDRTGDLEFIVPNGNDYQTTYRNIRRFFCGKSRVCVLDDEPEMNYLGRFALTDWQSFESFSTCVISYRVAPYRYSDDTIQNYDWIWDDMDFTAADENLLYGSFSVSGIKARTLVNPSNIDVEPSFTCSEPMTVEINGVMYSLPQGQTSHPGFVLHPGDNPVVFSGDGTVVMDYPMEVII